MTARPTRVLRATLRWLAPPLCMLAAAAGGGALVMQGPTGLFGWVFAGALLLVLGWILISVLWPGRADRTCSACGGEGLVRADASSTHGLECTLCGWRDAEASSFLLAEEEGPLEEIVLAERGRRPPRTDAGVDSDRAMV